MKILETSFPKNFRHEDIKKILDYATTGRFCQIICIPGAGKATILRLLAHNREVLKYHLREKEKFLRVVYLNLFELTNYDDASIAKFILAAMDLSVPENSDPIVLAKILKEAINKLANEGQVVIFLFDHFDEYQNRLPRSFFQMLKSTNALAQYKFSAVFATRRDLTQLVDQEITREFWAFFVENAVYLKIYDKEATSLLFLQVEKIMNKKLSSDQKDEIIKISGGHAKLTKIVAELLLRKNINLSTENLLQNESVLACLHEIWQFLTSEEQHTLFHVSQKETLITGRLIENLTKLDLLKVNDGQASFTIPLFGEFVKVTIQDTGAHKIKLDEKSREITKGDNILSDLFSPQELRLMKFLIQNSGRIVERDELIESVWPHTQVTDAISDEAIDQMIFRLRKKIEDEPKNPKHIITVKGRGFRFQP